MAQERLRLLEFYLLREPPRSVAGKRPAQLVAVDERPSAYGVVAAGDVHGQAALGRAGQLVPSASQPARRRVVDHAALHRRAAGRDGRAGRDLRADAELVSAIHPCSWAATTATWGVDNRSAGVRAIGGGDDIAPVEHRQAGADANPYPAAALAIAAGLDGVRRGCEPPPAVDGDVYALADGAVPALPATLAEATDLLERSALARDWLGDDVVEHCVAMRRSEVVAHAAAVTDWEIERYLEAP